MTTGRINQVTTMPTAQETRLDRRTRAGALSNGWSSLQGIDIRL